MLFERWWSERDAKQREIFSPGLGVRGNRMCFLSIVILLVFFVFFFNDNARVSEVGRKMHYKLYQ